MPEELTLTQVVSGLETDLRSEKQDQSPMRLRVLMNLFGLSLRNVVDAGGRAISRSQLHRILRGQRPTAFERHAIAVGVMTCLRERCDSAFLFAELENPNVR